MFALLALATADDLTWTCPVLETVGDAEGFRSVGYLGTDELLEELEAFVFGDGCYRDSACLDDYWVDCPVDCESATGVHVVGTDQYQWDAWRTWTLQSSYSLIAPPGSTWTSMTFRREWVYSTSLGCCSTWNDWEASWEGVIDPRWPSDATIKGQSLLDPYGNFEAWEDRACAWTARSDTSSYDFAVGEHSLSLDSLHCDAYSADLDGVSGFVDSWDWTLELPDEDRDGWPAGACDCDDTRSDVNVGVEEPHAADDLDSDCDGIAQPDADGDGFGSAEFGGDDCDDSLSTVNPDGRETGVNDVDEDCDGVVASDLDGDGDPDEVNGGHDCADRDASRSSLLEEIPGNGHDEDCDGKDGTIVWGFGTAPESPAGLPAPADLPEPGGCGRGLGALALLPLLRRRRGSTPPPTAP